MARPQPGLGGFPADAGTVLVMLHPMPPGYQVKRSSLGGLIITLASMDARGFDKTRGQLGDRDSEGRTWTCLAYPAERIEEWSRPHSSRLFAVTENCMLALSEHGEEVSARNLLGLIDLGAASDAELTDLIDQVRDLPYQGSLLAHALLVRSSTDSVYWSGISADEVDGLDGPTLRQLLEWAIHTNTVGLGGLTHNA